MPRERCLEIDEPVDLQIAEVLMQERKARERKQISFHSVRMLILDFDGVLTDNRVLMDQQGSEAVWCHRGDGWGIVRVKDMGVEVIVLSTETNPVVSARCTKLGISCVQGCEDKLTSLKQLIRKRGLKPEQVVYVGNDVNDLDCMYWVGVPIAVADAVPEVRKAARLVTARLGGRGAVREVCDLIMLDKKGAL